MLLGACSQSNWEYVCENDWTFGMEYVGKLCMRFDKSYSFRHEETSTEQRA